MIEGFTFENTGLTSGSERFTAANSAQRAVYIRASGKSPSEPAIIRKCEFLGFSDTGIGIADFPLAYWEFSGNTFDGSRLAIWINQADFVTIRDNTFRNYVVGVGFDPGDVVTDLTITGNRFEGGSFDPALSNFYGLYLSAVAATATESKHWDISGNLITSATVGIRVFKADVESLMNVSVRDNCIFDNNVSSTLTPHGVLNTSSQSLDAIGNWWGNASCPFHPTSNPGGLGNQVSDNVDFNPWLTSPASPCAPPVVEVSIDIKPGSDPNSINPSSKGVIPVAILTTDTFDATTVDPATVLFGKTGTEAAPAHSALEDVDGDGDTDMILHFNTQDTGIKCGDTFAILTGETFSVQVIQGSDSIKTVGCK